MSSDCFKKSSEINKNINNKKNENKKNINKKLKLKIFSVLILVISFTLFVYFIKKNYKINNWFSNKINKNNFQKIKKMKHAILLLSSYGVDYLNNFLYQFKNDSRFDIYIN